LEDGDRDGLAARAGDGGVDVAVGVDGGVGDGVEVFGHGDGDAEVERIAGVAVAMQDEVAGDGAFGNLDGGPRRAAEDDGGGGVAEGGAGDSCAVRIEVRAVDIDLSAGHSCGWGDAVEVWLRGVGLVGHQECAQGGHGLA